MANLDLKQMRGPDSPKRMRACGEHASASQVVHRGFSYAARPPLLTTRVCDIAAIRDSDAASLRLLRAPMPRKQAPYLDERSEPSAFAKAATAGCGPCGYRS